MRTATDFNLLYAKPDPWRLASTRFRDKVLRHHLLKFISGRSVLELGCGEGHLTEALFSQAAHVTGIDISGVAIARARGRGLSYAGFDCGDFLDASFEGYDVIAAIECLYYLSRDEQEAFFAKVSREHGDKALIVSGPITGGKYFTHSGLLETFHRHGFAVIEHGNTFVDWRRPASFIAGRIVRLPFGLWLMDRLPESFIRQRYYVVRAISPAE